MNSAAYYLPPRVITIDRSLLETPRTMDHGYLSPCGYVSERSRQAAHRRDNERLARLVELDRVFDWLRECPQKTIDTEYGRRKEQAVSTIQSLEKFISLAPRKHRREIDRLKQKFSL
jgi:hypothetical protein